MKRANIIISLRNFIKETLLLIIIVVFVFLCIFIYFKFEENNNITNYLKALKEQYIIQQNITYESFNNLSQNSFYGIINKPEIYNLVKHAYKKDQKTQDFLRKTLHEKLISDYNRLENFKFKQIHFHFPNNSSFLRMHNIDKYDDNLEEFRFSVSQVNKYLRPVDGFEVGRSADAFRFVYPLFDEELFHIGSVEISVSSSFFDKVFEKNYNVDSHFLIQKQIIERKMLPDYFDKYQVSFENSDYVYSENIKEENTHYVDSNFYTKSEKEFIQKKMNNSEDFIFYKKYNNKYFAIYFLPISNTEGIKNSAYMVLYKDSDFIKQVKYNYFKMIFVLSLFFIFFIIYLKYRYKQIEEKRNREYVFSQQSKMAALGEMIENIAHQWRQPLSVISILASGLKLKKKCDILDDKEFYENLEGIVKNTTYLSNTIEDFRNYFNETLEKKNFNLKNTIQQCILMFKDDLTLKNIILIENITDIEICSYETEFKQVLINMLKNTKDFASDGLVLINAYEKNNKIIIEIQDTAGGIPENIIKRIFEPYFTTKHKSVGIGLGLYSSYEIVNNKLKGEIYVVNKEFNYNFKTYKGACFTIILYRDKL